ncbi:MAG: ATP-binding protein [Spirochaetes bacterium GWB1_48_6]|nr:MAG: ATP-binding protein [Spirochaetes bacterium GWB1_48_6]
MQIIPIASGKGGVGKSLLAANLAIALAQNGKKVILADLDLGGSNLHLILGLRSLPQGIGTFFTTSSVKFKDLLVKTDVPNLLFIPGDSEIPGMANLKPAQKRSLITELKSLDAEFLIIDLGAGTGSNTIDLFLMSSHGIIVTTPTLTSTLNAYFFLKNSIFRILDTSFKKGSWASNHLKMLTTGASIQKIYVPRFLDLVKKEDPESYQAYRAHVEYFQPRLVFNMLEDPKDVEKAAKVRRSTKEYLGLDLEHLGVIFRDELQDIALGSRLPIILYKPQSLLSQAIYRIADKLIQFDRADEAPLDIEALEETHQVAAMEAEIDFEAKIAYIEDLLNTGALSIGDLVETIKTQQLEMTKLRNENNLLKSKIVKAINGGFTF